MRSNLSIKRCFQLAAAVLGCVLVPGQISAEPASALSLDTLIATVERENPSVKAARTRWEAMKLRVPQARAWADPMVGADVEREGTTQLNKYSNIEWMASQEIPVSGKNLSRGRIAEAEARVSYEEYRRLHLNVLTRARTTYFRLANAHAQLELNERNRTLQGQFAEISRVKYESGTQTQSEVLMAQTELMRLDETRNNLQRDIEELSAELNVLMNRAPMTPLGRPVDLTFKPLALSRERIEELAHRNRPELRLAGRRIEGATAQLQLARRQWIPDPQFRIEARQFADSNEGIREYDTGIFFSVPWVNYRKYSAGVAEARRGVEAARLDETAARTEMHGLIHHQLERIESYARNYTLFRDHVMPLTRQTVETTRAGYETNTTGFLELTTARRASQDAESAMLEHLMNHQMAIAELESLVGGFRQGADGKQALPR